MSHAIFSDAWAKAWAEQLNSSPDYRRAARDWHGSICFRSRDRAPAQEKSIFLDLEAGVCRAARSATAEDLAAARYVLSASERTWQKLVTGRFDPLVALLTGLIRFERGRLTDFAERGAAAKELMLAAQRISDRQA